MSKIDPKILSRIKKCLALASSANEHEAAAALNKAREIMAEHGLDDEALKLAEVELERTRRPTKANRPPRWELALIDIISGTFAVEPIILGVDVGFAGIASRSTIAVYAFDMVRRIITRKRSDYIKQHLRRCKAGTKRARADHYCTGFVRGIEMEIICLVPERRECELSKKWLAETFTRTESVKARAPAATKSRSTSDDYWNGFDEGHKVKLHQGLAGGQVTEPERLSA